MLRLGLPRLVKSSEGICRNVRRWFQVTSSLAQESEELQVREQQQRNKEVGELTELVRDFLDPRVFYQQLKTHGIDFFCGVPDSLLKDFCAYVTHTAPQENHVITANEGSAVAMAAGYHLSTGKSAMVYLQNSGIGNTVNPLMSLSVPSVYSIPMLLLIGWRGEPGKRDEPQHRAQGQVTPGLLAALGIPFQPLPDYEEGAEQVCNNYNLQELDIYPPQERHSRGYVLSEIALQSAKHYMDLSKGPYALLVRRQTFLPYKLPKEKSVKFPLTREDSLRAVLSCLGPKDIVVGTTGMLSRELYEYRVEHDMGHERDFLTVGSMGHASSIAQGIALQKPNRQVVCLDGDGAAIMHMGAMATIGQRGPPNLKHIIINNGAHDSVGGQPTDAKSHDNFSFSRIALGCGYKEAVVAVTEKEVMAGTRNLRSMQGPVLLEIKAALGARHDLGRPKQTPVENKDDFMHFLAIK